jgi:hypothetical protein
VQTLRHIEIKREFMNTEINHKELFFKPGVSPTSINQFFESPSRFWRFSSLNPNKQKKEPTPAMIFGRLVHCLALTPEDFDKQFIIEPVKPDGAIDTMDDMKDLLSKLNIAYKKSSAKPELLALVREAAPRAIIWGDIKDAFGKSIGKKIIVTRDDYAKAKSMQDAMLANKAVRQLIGNGFSESPFCWFPDGEIGLMKKVRLDYVRQGLVIEYKTDSYPHEQDFSKTIGNMGYHRQLAMQIEAAERMHGERPRGAIIIAQDKDMHDDIAVYALNTSTLSRGADENAWAWGEINRRIKTGDWKTFPEKIMPIGLPKWYETNNPLPEIAA